MKIVLNECYGGFNVSEEFLKFYKISDRYSNQINRCDVRLIEYIEKFGSEKASGINSRLKIFEIEDGKRYYLEEYDGYEILITEDNMPIADTKQNKIYL